MSELMISRAFVKKLASNIRVTYGKEVKHTDAIELVAGSLGWKADALMHKLKQAELTQSAEVLNSSAETVVKHNSKFENLEPLTSFVHAIIHDKLDVAEEYAPLISDESAWCCFALGLYHHILHRRGKSFYLDAESYLVKAFQLDAETVRYAAQIVNLPFTPSSEGASLFHMMNQREFDGIYAPKNRYVRGDLMAWATRIAQERGFLVNTAGGLIIKEKPEYHDRIFNDPMSKLLELESDELWEFVKDGVKPSVADKIDHIRNIIVKEFGLKSTTSMLFTAEDRLKYIVGFFSWETIFSVAKGDPSTDDRIEYKTEFHRDILDFILSLPDMKDSALVNEGAALNPDAQLTKEAEALIKAVCGHVKMKMNIIFG